MSTSRGLRNNNPGNIRVNSDRFLGEIIPSRDQSFKQFVDIKHGYRAMFVILRNYQLKHGLKTIDEFIHRWAPNEENDTESYIRTVCDTANIAPGTNIDVTDKDVMCEIVAGMSLVENGEWADMEEVKAGFGMV